MVKMSLPRLNTAAEVTYVRRKYVRAFSMISDRLRGHREDQFLHRKKRFTGQGLRPATASAAQSVQQHLRTDEKLIDNRGQKPTVMVGLSGGVDSSVAAYLLKERGFHVIGVHMKNWDSSDEAGESLCPIESDYKDVEKVAKHLDIECRQVNFEREYWNNVFTPFIEGYTKGLTPNPDILCNSEIKFKEFIAYAEGEGADFVATGHYARLRKTLNKTDTNLPFATAYDDAVCPEVALHDTEACICPDDSIQAERASTVKDMTVSLTRCADSSKDQTYFLAGVPGHSFRRVLFPLSSLRKAEVRRLAAAVGLPTAAKRDSVGICFIGKRKKFSDFMQEYVEPRPGPFRDVVSGQVVGQHTGLCHYTIGQGARIGGQRERWFVAHKQADTNEVLVCSGTDHPALFCDKAWVRAAEFNWISGAIPQELRRGEALRGQYQVRYRQELADCTVRRVKASEVEIIRPAYGVRSTGDPEAQKEGSADACGPDENLQERGPSAGNGRKRGLGDEAASEGVSDREQAIDREEGDSREGAGHNVEGETDEEGEWLLEVQMDEPHRAVAASQMLVLYSGRSCLGGGPVYQAGPSFFEQGRDLPGDCKSWTM